MPLRAHLFDPSGGLPYHLRALRWRRRLWAPFHAQVAGWLAAWRPPCPDLVLVGPSGGYSLSAEFLARFARVHVLEPDPLARLILQRRFAGTDWLRGNTDALALPAGPATLATRYPGCAILFCNVLGQVEDADATATLCARLRRALQGHHWASYHDLLSADTPPTTLTLPADTAPDPVVLAGRLWAGQRVEVTDHGTAALCDGPPALALWQLRPQRWQVVAWGSRRPAC